MGTRNLTMVIHKSEVKVAQYGQWDGHPSGQGTTILEFLLRVIGENRLDEFKEKLDNIRWISKEEIEAVDNTPDAHLKYPHLFREAGGDVLNAILFNRIKIFVGLDKKEVDVNVEYLSDSRNFAGDGLFCEWAYVIDLDRGTFEIYKGFGKEPLTESDRFFHLQKDEEEYKPVKIIKEYRLDNLPTIYQMLSETQRSDEGSDD